MNRFVQAVKYGAVATLVTAGAAHAALPAGVQEAIDEMKENGIAVATAFILAVIAVAAIKFLRSAK